MVLIRHFLCYMAWIIKEKNKSNSFTYEKYENYLQKKHNRMG